MILEQQLVMQILKELNEEGQSNIPASSIKALNNMGDTFSNAVLAQMAERGLIRTDSPDFAGRSVAPITRNISITELGVSYLQRA